MKGLKESFLTRVFILAVITVCLVLPPNPAVSDDDFSFLDLDTEAVEVVNDQQAEEDTSGSSAISDEPSDYEESSSESGSLSEKAGNLWDFVSNDLFSNLSFKQDDTTFTHNGDTLTAGASASAGDGHASAQANADLATFDAEAKSGWTLSWKDLNFLSHRSTDTLHADVGAHANANAGYDIGIPSIGYADKTTLSDPDYLKTWKKDYYAKSEDKDGDGKIDNPFNPPNITLASAQANAHADVGVNVNYEHLDEWDVLGGLFYMDQKENVDLFAGAEANAHAKAGVSTDFIGLNLGADAFAGARARVAALNTLGINRQSGGPSVSFGANAEGTAGAGAGANLVLGLDREKGLMFSLGGKASAGLGLGAGFTVALNPGDKVNQVVYNGIQNGTEQVKKLHGAIVDQTKATGRMIKDSFNTAKQSVSNAKDAFASGVTNLRDKTVAKAKNIKKSVVKKAGNVKKAVTSKAKSIKNTVAKKASSFKKTVAKKASSVKKAVTKKAKSIKKTASKAASNIKKTVAKKASSVKKTVTKKASSIKKSVAKKASSFKKTVAKKASSVKKAVSSKAKSVKKTASSLASKAKSFFGF